MVKEFQVRKGNKILSKHQSKAEAGRSLANFLNYSHKKKEKLLKEKQLKI